MTLRCCLVGNRSQASFDSLLPGAPRLQAPHNVAVKTEANIMGNDSQDWFLRDWMKIKGKKQADLIRDLGWERGHASKIYNGRISYARRHVVELSRWLEIEPFELLMFPADAIALRSLRDAARQIVQNNSNGGSSVR